MKTTKLITIIISALIISLNAKAQVTVLSSGNVGIGTNNPTYKLHVLGDKALFSSNQSPSSAAFIRCNAANSTATTPEYTWFNDDNTGLFHPAVYNIGFTIGGNERMRINSNGQLQFNNGGTAGISSAGTPDITWTSDLTTGIFHSGANIIGFSVGGSEKMRVHSNGFVGINQTSPTMPLHVGGNGLFSTGTNPTSAAYIRAATAMSTATTPDYTWYGNDQAGLFHPSQDVIGFATTGSERVRIDNSGHVGIGQTNPSQVLDVNGNAIIEGANKLFVDNTNKYVGISTGSDLGLINKDGTWLRVGSYGGIAFWASGTSGTTGETGSAYNMFINQYGLGVGPSAQAWSGTPNVNFYLNGNGWVNGSFGWSSDKRFKKNINKIDGALDKILKLNGKVYEYNKEEFKEYNFNDGKNLGFIAQELMEVLPEAVLKNDKGYYGINYIAVIPVLVEAIKEQNKTIEAQKNDIQSLKDNAQNLTQQISSCCQTSTNITSGITNSNTSNTIPNANSSALYQNVPNPFSENTEIAYTVAPNSQKGTLYIFDMQGTLLKTYDNLKTGSGKLVINGGEYKPGMYLYSLVVDSKEIDTKRMILTSK